MPIPLLPYSHSGALKDILPKITSYMHPLDLLLLIPSKAYYTTHLTHTEMTFFSDYLPSYGSKQKSYLAKRIPDHQPIDAAVKRCIISILGLFRTSQLWQRGVFAGLYYDCYEVIEIYLQPQQLDFESLAIGCCMLDAGDIFKRILRARKVNGDLKVCMNMSCARGSSSIVEALLSHRCIDRFDISWLEKSCFEGYVDIVRMLIEDGSVVPTSGCLYWSVLKGYKEVVKILLSDKRIDPNDADCRALKAACDEGYVDIVEMLLDDARVKPRVICLIGSCKKGRESVVRLLLNDGRLNPADCNSRCLYWACRKGYLSLVKMLLVDGRADPCAKSNRALKISCSRGYRDVVDVLLRDGRCKPTVDNLIRCCKKGNVDALAVLLKDPRVDPSEKNSACLYWGCKNGYRDVVDLLLKDGRVNVEPCLWDSVNRFNIEIVVLLMQRCK